MANSDQTECLHNAQVENPTKPVNSVTSNKEILRCLAACLPWNRCVEKDMDDEISDRRAHTRLHASIWSVKISCSILNNRLVTQVVGPFHSGTAAFLIALFRMMAASIYMELFS